MQQTKVTSKSVAVLSCFLTEAENGQRWTMSLSFLSLRKTRERLLLSWWRLDGPSMVSRSLSLQAYRLEPLILKHYSNISPVQIHWYNTTNPLPYDHMKPSFLNPTKEPTSVSESESLPTLPSPTTSPVMARRHYGESITNIGKASILGNYSWSLETSLNCGRLWSVT